jgi:hypothetical protein
MARVHIYSVGSHASMEGARTISSREGYYGREGMRWLIFSQLHSSHMARCHNLTFQSKTGPESADYGVDREEVAGQSSGGAQFIQA